MNNLNKMINPELELEKQIYIQHKIGSKIALTINIIWSIFNYFILPDHNLEFTIAGITISIITFFSVIFSKKLKISPQVLGLIPMTLMNIYFAFIYNHLNLDAFSKYTYIYVAFFLGASMSLLWEIKYSILTVIIAIISNVIFFNLYSALSVEEYLYNGGILTFSTASFLIFFIYKRYQRVVFDIRVKYDLLTTKNEIERAKDQNRLLFNKAPHPMLIYSLNDLSILDVNDTMVKKYGYSKQEFLNMKITQLRPEKELKKLKKDIVNIKKGIEKKDEWIHLLKDGTKIDVEISAKSIDYNNQKARLVLIKDITQKKLINKKLKESEKEHWLLFKNNPIPMFVFSKESNSIVEINNSMESKYGYSKTDFSNLKLINEPLFSSICEIIKLDEDDSKEYSHITKAGNLIIIKATTCNIKFKNNDAKLISINDITETKLNQLALEDAKRLAEESKNNQSRFLSNMSHEIRTPMNGILGMTRLIQKTKLNQEQKKYSKAIYTSADNLMVIINEILDFSKIEAGKLNIERTPFNLEELTHIWQETLKLSANEKNIEFEINTQENVPINLIGDPIRLNQIIYNLGGNAIKFTEKGKVIINIKVKESYDHVSVLQFDVIDNGIGIAENKLDTIFSSFSQASSNTTRKYGGTGLGLTITKQLIELQDGDIWVESVIGEGSTFSFTLKYDIQKEIVGKTTEKEIVEMTTEKENLGALNILLVEDHDINQMLATTVLEGWNFNVDLAENGKEAVEKVDSGKYDVILMDIHMPIMDGYEASKEIRIKLKNSTPIIAMTASARIGDNQKCFDVGMNDYISKPFNPELLLEKISSQINKQKTA